jgi:EAL domain-containing protein (putative c-di-GMP-specific phosphodiesterase class I)
VIKLGSELGARVVAEGVEQQTERDLLGAMGCSFAQGYLFSRPLPACEFSAVAG